MGTCPEEFRLGNAIGGIRPHTDMSQGSAEYLAAVAMAVTNRPRKVLGWKIPAEVFAEQLHRSGVVTNDSVLRRDTIVQPGPPMGRQSR